MKQRERLISSGLAIAFGVLLAGVFVIGVRPATATAFCREYHQHSICILRIQRSAKYYWQYRAVVKIDRIERPMAVYDCRQRVRIESSGGIVAFQENGAGEFICRYFKA